MREKGNQRRERKRHQTKKCRGKRNHRSDVKMKPEKRGKRKEKRNERETRRKKIK